MPLSHLSTNSIEIGNNINPSTIILISNMRDRENLAIVHYFRDI